MSAPEEALDALAKRYLAAQLAGDRREALRIVLDEGFHRGVSVPDLHLGVIEVSQREVGRLWQDNRISVADEHLATSISQLVLSVLYEHLPRQSPIGRQAVVACVEGELHDMGGRMGADFLEMAGFDVRFLGANVPTDALVRAVTERDVDLLGLSATMSYHAPALERAVDAVRAARGPTFPIVVGGHVVAWAPELRSRLGVAVLGGRADEMVAAARQVFT